MTYLFSLRSFSLLFSSLSSFVMFRIWILTFSGKWQSSEAMTMDRSRIGVAVHNNKLYAFGGYNGFERLSIVEVYNPVLKTWKSIAPMHHKRRYEPIKIFTRFYYQALKTEMGNHSMKIEIRMNFH